MSERRERGAGQIQRGPSERGAPSPVDDGGGVPGLGVAPTPDGGRPVPDPDGVSGEFYAHAREGVLRLQRCSACGTWRHPPRLRCAACGSEAVAWEPVSGRGRLFSWTVTHQAFDPAFAARVPYVTSVVELEEGPRLVALFEGERDDLRLDRPVEVVFDPSEPGSGLLVLRPR